MTDEEWKEFVNKYSTITPKEVIEERELKTAIVTASILVVVIVTVLVLVL